MSDDKRNKLNDTQDIAIQVMQGELNNATATIIQLKTQLIIANKEIEELKTPTEKKTE